MVFGLFKKSYGSYDEYRNDKKLKGEIMEARKSGFRTQAIKQAKEGGRRKALGTFGRFKEDIAKVRKRASKYTKRGARVGGPRIKPRSSGSSQAAELTAGINTGDTPQYLGKDMGYYEVGSKLRKDLFRR